MLGRSFRLMPSALIGAALSLGATSSLFDRSLLASPLETLAAIGPAPGPAPSRGTPQLHWRRSRLSENRGTGPGSQRAAERETRKLVWQGEFYRAALPEAAARYRRDASKALARLAVA